MNKKRFIIFIVIIVLSMNGCSQIFIKPTPSKKTPIKEISYFVEEALKEAVSQKNKKKEYTGHYLISFYAEKLDKGNSKQEQPKKKNHPLKQLKSLDTATTWIKYKLECQRRGKWTFKNCLTIDKLKLSDSENWPNLNFKLIQQRKNSRLKIMVEHTADRSPAKNVVVQHRLKCNRKVLKSYSQCKGSYQPLDAYYKNNAGLFIEQLRLGKNNQLEILIGKPINKTQKKEPDKEDKPGKSIWQRDNKAHMNGKQINFKVLMLKDDLVFKDASKESLSKNLKTTLGESYISHTDHLITPGQFRLVNTKRGNIDTQYVGVLVDDWNDNQKVWKKVIKIKHSGNVYPIHIHFRRNGVNILTKH